MTILLIIIIYGLIHMLCVSKRKGKGKIEIPLPFLWTNLQFYMFYVIEVYK